MRVFVTLSATSGFRKADMALDPKVPFTMAHLSLRFVGYRFEGTDYACPTLALLLAPNARTFSFVRPPPSKADFDGSRYGQSPICSRYHPTAPINLCRELLRYELARGLFAPEQRRLAPLLLNANGVCWRKPQLADFFRQLCLQIMPAADADKLSVHSFRIYLACALRDRGVPPDTIKEILRWASDHALALYARANIEADAATRQSAGEASVNSVRMTTVLAAGSEGSPSLAQSLFPPRPTAPSAFEHDADHTQRESVVADALAGVTLNSSAPVPVFDSELHVFAAINAASTALTRQAQAASRENDATSDEGSDKEP